MKTVYKGWEQSLPCLMSRHQHKEPREINIQAKLVLTEEQGKFPETNPNKVEFYDSPDRIQNSCH